MHVAGHRSQGRSALAGPLLGRHAPRCRLRVAAARLLTAHTFSLSSVAMYPNNGLSSLFQASVEATEEAIVNAMVATKTMIGASGLRVVELLEEQLRG